MNGISIIIPVRNEGDNVEPLFLEINKVLSEIQLEWECIWINDNSQDNTKEKLEKLCKHNNKHKLFSHILHYGQSAAILTGIEKAYFDILVTIDGDGQNDPGNIPELVDIFIVNKLDMVCGWRKNRRDNLSKKISSKVANFYRNLIIKDKIHDTGCSLKVFRKECVLNIPHFKSMHRFLPALISFAGYNKIIEQPVNHRPRNAGKTNYGIHNRLWIGILDLFVILWMKKRLVYPKLSEKK